MGPPAELEKLRLKIPTYAYTTDSEIAYLAEVRENG